MLSCHQSAHLTETKALGDWIFPRKVGLIPSLLVFKRETHSHDDEKPSL